MLDHFWPASVGPMLPHGDLMYQEYYQYKMVDWAPKLIQPSYLLSLPASTFPLSIPMLDWVVPYATSLSRAKVESIPLSRPPHLPKMMQPIVVSFVPITKPSANKGKAPALSKSLAHSPFELSLMADIP